MWLGRSFAIDDVVTDSKINAAESAFGILGWLSSRQPEVTFGSKTDARPAAELAAAWCRANDLGEPRSDYAVRITRPATAGEPA